jgi:hypothetical protein
MSSTLHQSLLGSFFNDEDEEYGAETQSKRQKASHATQRFLRRIKKEPFDEDSCTQPSIEESSLESAEGPSQYKRKLAEMCEEEEGKGVPKEKSRKNKKNKMGPLVKRETSYSVNRGTGLNAGKKNSSWGSMNVADKASALKTYVTRYGTSTICKELKCVRKEAYQSLRKLETLVESISNSSDMMSFFLENEQTDKKKGGKNSSPKDLHANSIRSILNDIVCIREEVVPVLSSFIQHDVRTIREIEEDVEGFVSEVSEQCDDVLYGNPPPAPEEYICTSMFSVYQSAKAHGRRKSSNTSRIPPSTLRTGDLASSMMQSSGSATIFRQSSGKNGRGNLTKTGSSDRRRRSIGTCPVKNEFCRNVENLMM